MNRSRLPKKPAAPESPLPQRITLEQAFDDVTKLGLEEGTRLHGQPFSLAAWSEYPIVMTFDDSKVSSDPEGVRHQTVRVRGLYYTPAECGGRNTFVPIGVEFRRTLPPDVPDSILWESPLNDCYWEVAKIRFQRMQSSKMHTIDFEL